MTGLAIRALENPSGAGEEAAAALEAEPSAAREWLLLLSAVFYHRPELVPQTAVARLPEFLSGPGCGGVAAHVVQQLLPSAHGARLLEAVLERLRDPGLATETYEALIGVLRHATRWAPGLLDANRAIALARLAHLAPQRKTLVEDVIERCVLAEGSVTQAQREFLAEHSPYCLYYLEGKASVAFPLHAEVERRLGHAAARVLIVHNIRDGQGDEILRCVPLLQALADFHPGLEITMLTRRVYLYAHPRIHAVSILDRDRVSEIWQKSYDLVVEYYEENIREGNYVPELRREVDAYLERHTPFLFLRSTKGYNHFLFERVEMDGRPMAAPLGLDRPRVPNAYETTGRLIAELGLPLRAGQMEPRSEWVLAGVPWPEAETTWRELTAGNERGKPVALLSPFGGVEPLKGYTDPAGIAAEIGALVAEGFFVAVMPNGNPWGSAGMVRSAIALLSPEEQANAAVAPDPAGDAEHADRIMRLATHFVRFADLVVTVEGWMMHEAYCLGKSYRVLMLAYSHPDSWHPYCRSRRQDVWPAAGAPKDTAQPDRHTLLFLLRELCVHPEALPYLRGAAGSAFRDVRAAAASSLGIVGSVEELSRLLRDPSHVVRGAAANGLLARASGEPLVEWLVHSWIAEGEPGWLKVHRAGDAARGALEVAAADEDPGIRREAKRILSWPNSTKSPDGLSTLAALKKIAKMLATPRRLDGRRPKVLVLTPVKDASVFVSDYCERLLRLSYPKHLLSVGLLESDSRDRTVPFLEKRLPEMRRAFGRARLWKRDFGFRIPEGQPRWAESIQLERRIALARSRNYLLSRALADEDWVLWLDVDVLRFPQDIVEQLLAAGRDILQPHCVLDPGGRTFDRNAWRYEGKPLYMDDLRPEGEFVKLDAVGGTMLLVRADLHRTGLNFPAFGYRSSDPRVPGSYPETEGLGLMANDMGYTCWGMPRLEIYHCKA